MVVYTFAGKDNGTEMIAFERGSNRLNFWLSAGTIASYVAHPKTQHKKKRTQLFRRNIDRKSQRTTILDI